MTHRSRCNALFSVLAVLFLTACSDVDTARWTEEVKSWDGRNFRLEGYAEQRKNGWPMSHRGTTRFIEYYHRETGAYWKQDFGYHPVVFDLVDGKPVVLLRANSDGQCFQHGYPRLGLIAFRWSGAGWEQMSLDGLPIDKMSFNVLETIFDRKDPARDAQGSVSLLEKRRRDVSEVRLAEWIARTGRRCLEVKAQPGQGRCDCPPPPVLTGSHGLPKRFENG